VGKSLRVGIVGVGTISGQYLATIDSLAELELVHQVGKPGQKGQRQQPQRPGVDPRDH